MIRVKCPWCDKTFYQRAAMTYHIDCIHGDKTGKTLSSSKAIVRRLFNK